MPCAKLIECDARRLVGLIGPGHESDPALAGTDDLVAELLVVDDRNRALLVANLTHLRLGEHRVEKH